MPGLPQAQCERVDGGVCWTLESHLKVPRSPATLTAGRSANESTESSQTWNNLPA